MALSPDLAQFANKASGIYRLEFDKSQTATIPAETIRLVVGFSKKGPFQTPVFVPDTGFFEEVYGPIDRGLERKKSYFHRTALAALERGPILALNLLRLNNDEDSVNVDKVEYQTLSASICTANQVEKEALYSGFYNKDRFWFPETEAFLENIGDINKGIIQFTNLNQTPVSIIVRHAQNVQGFNITAKEWYGIGNVPEFMHENDYIKDFMVDVIVVEGDWTNYQKLSIDPIFGQYFDETKGLIKSELTNMLQDPNVSIIATYTGALIPDFIDLQGNNLFIENLINFDTSTTGLFCAVDKDAFDDRVLSGTCDGIDMIGHNLENLTNTDPSFTSVKFLSYDRTIKDDLSYGEFQTPEIEFTVDSSEDINFYLSSAPGAASQTPPVTSSADAIVAGSGDVNYVVAIGISTHSEFASLLDGNVFTNEPGSTSRKVGSYVLMTDGASYKWAPVVSLSAVSGVFSIGLSVEEAGYEVHVDAGKMFIVSAPNWLDHDNINFKFNAAKYNGLYDDYIEGVITSGDKVWAGTESSSWFLKFTNTSYTDGFITDGTVGNGAQPMGSSYGVPSALVEAYEEETYVTLEQLPAPGPGAYFEGDGSTPSADLNIISLAGKLNATIEVDVTASNALPANEVYVSKADYNSVIQVNDYLVAAETGANGESRLTKVNKIVAEGALLRIVTDAEIKKTTLPSTEVTVERYREIETVIEHYKFFELNGFNLNPLYHMPNATQDRVDEIYDDTLAVDSNLFKALIDKDNISFRYIVDTFGLGIQTESKYQLSRLASRRQNAVALLNAPSMDDFKKSTNPKFVDATGSLSTRFIASGGDLSQNPDFVYSLPSIKNGANYSSFFSPYIVVRDRGKNITVPPAGVVSNNFIDKYTTSLPWSIVAGPRRGVLSAQGLVGLEMNFNKEDRDDLEPFGLNPIIFQRGVGLMIASNKTAQQNPKSALSSTHVREVLIYIQDGIAEILKNYQFEFNTAQTRLEIVTLADNFLTSIQQDNGVYDFKNVMDESNNTNDVIDSNMGVLDTFIEPVKGLEILIHRTTVLKTGAIATGQYR